MRMTARFVYVFLPLFILGGVSITTPPRGVVETHEVKRVVDGDTLVLGNGKRVRLYGIDCPERSQPYGAQAMAFTKAMVEGRRVQVMPVGEDRYGRIVARVRIGDVDLGVQLLMNGLAWWAHMYARDREFVAAENYARVHRLGLWQNSKSIPPWVYRLLKKECRRCLK